MNLSVPNNRYKPLPVEVCRGFHSWLSCANKTSNRFESRNGLYLRTLGVMPEMTQILYIDKDFK
jgi:hypothetical protein